MMCCTLLTITLFKSRKVDRKNVPTELGFIHLLYSLYHSQGLERIPACTGQKADDLGQVARLSGGGYKQYAVRRTKNSCNLERLIHLTCMFWISVEKKSTLT